MLHAVAAAARPTDVSDKPRVHSCMVVGCMLQPYRTLAMLARPASVKFEVGDVVSDCMHACRYSRARTLRGHSTLVLSPAALLACPAGEQAGHGQSTPFFCQLHQRWADHL